MLKKITVIILFTAVFFYNQVIYGEQVILKTGKIVEGKIIEDTDEYVKLDVEGIKLTYFKDEIERIDRQVTQAPSKKELRPNEILIKIKGETSSRFKLAEEVLKNIDNLRVDINKILTDIHKSITNVSAEKITNVHSAFLDNQLEKTREKIRELKRLDLPQDYQKLREITIAIGKEAEALLTDASEKYLTFAELIKDWPNYERKIQEKQKEYDAEYTHLNEEIQKLK
jgi:hypothetical protein